MFGRENVVGMLLLGLCGVVAALILFSIFTGTRLHYTGPRWVGIALFLLVTGASLFTFVRQPGRRWPWDRGRDQKQDDQ